MSDVDFSKAIYVAAAPGLTRLIGDIDDAIDFLEEWPETLRDARFEVLLRACQRAKAGFVTAEVIQGAFEYWAKANGVLESVAPPSLWATRASSGGAAL